MVKETGLYDELGIAPDATAQQIRSAYRSMALKYHPDKNNGDAAAAEKFKKVAEAYEILSDADRRKQYDTFGRSGPGGAGGGGFPGGSGFHGGFGGPGMDPMDIFSHFFGFAAGGPQQQQRQERQHKPPFILIELQCSLEELYCGTTKVLQVKRRRPCPTCRGHGTANGKPVPVCPQCKGKKMINRQISFGGLMTFQQVPCQYCQGGGKMPIAAACAKCGPVFEAHARSQALGSKKDPMPRGVVLEEKLIKVTIAPGTEDSDAISFAGQGDELPGFDAVGDILVVMEQLPHPCYRRLNNTDLFLSNCRVPLWRLFQDSLAIPIELLDGRVVRLAPPRREGGVPQFLFDAQHVFVVENEGMPVKPPRGAAAASSASNGDMSTPKRGKLYVCVEVLFPSFLTPPQLKMLAEALGCNDADADAHATTAPQESLLTLQPHHGPAPSWHTVDAQGNATYKARSSNVRSAKKKKKTTAQ
jgi:DnaJ-class molecular chaperone